jgi:HNH endonuclease
MLNEAHLAAPVQPAPGRGDEAPAVSPDKSRNESGQRPSTGGSATPPCTPWAEPPEIRAVGFRERNVGQRCFGGFCRVCATRALAAFASATRRRGRKARAQAFRRDCGECQEAGNGPCAGRMEVHHVVPVTAGGEPYDVDNLVTLCQHHHAPHEARMRVATRA